MKKLIVKINGKQKNEQQETIKMQAMANSYEKKDFLYVIYKEQEINKEQEISTMLKIGKDSLILTRTGGVKQQQLFSKGQESTSEYMTPYGNLQMTVKTHRFKIVTGIISTIEIEYALYINGSWQSDNELIIKLEPAN